MNDAETMPKKKFVFLSLLDPVASVNEILCACLYLSSFIFCLKFILFGCCLSLTAGAEREEN